MSRFFKLANEDTSCDTMVFDLPEYANSTDTPFPNVSLMSAANNTMYMELTISSNSEDLVTRSMPVGAWTEEVELQSHFHGDQLTVEMVGKELSCEYVFRASERSLSILKSLEGEQPIMIVNIPIEVFLLEKKKPSLPKSDFLEQVKAFCEGMIREAEDLDIEIASKTFDQEEVDDMASLISSSAEGIMDLMHNVDASKFWHEVND